MAFDFTNFASGLAGAALGAGATLVAGHYQRSSTEKENEKQREFELKKMESQHAHDLRLQHAKERHDKDMERRAENIKNTGIASMREIGG